MKPNMDFENSLDDSVGILGSITVFAVFLVFIIHSRQKYKGTDKRILILSKISLLFNIIALIAVVLTYYEPYLFTTKCQCKLLWEIALVGFISGLYCIKFIYLIRVYIYCTGSAVGLNFKVPVSVYILTTFMIISCLFCVGLQFVTANGECYNNSTINGCIATFHKSDLYLGIIMVSFDIVLFVWFSKAWNDRIQEVLDNSTQQLRIANAKILKAFRIQLLLTTLALVMTLIDAGVHLIAPQNYSIHVFIIDNFTVCIANAFGFGKLRLWLYNLLTTKPKCCNSKKSDSNKDIECQPNRHSIPSNSESESVPFVAKE